MGADLSRGDIELVHLGKRFGMAHAVDDVNLRVTEGEFFSLLGPSGCGKTTTLRMIAGFEQPTDGRILLNGADITEKPAHRRQVNTVFQHYALFPHLNVFENIAYGLRRAKVATSEIGRRVGEALELVQLTSFAGRATTQMSGGQQQRVALARALVLKPAVLLLDEPLGALDSRLRKRLQIELKSLQQRIGITFIYVTHDQEEALTMSDRIAVMSNGRVVQVASPREIYEAPATTFVADFLGVSNLMDVMAAGAGEHGCCKVRLGGFELLAGCGVAATTGNLKLTIRPERVKLEPLGAGTGPNRVPGTVERWVYLGNSVQLIVRLATGTIIQVLIQNTGEEIPYPPGAAILVHFPVGSLRVLYDESSSSDSEGTPSG